MNIYKDVLQTILPEGFSKERMELKKFDIKETQNGDKILYPNTLVMHFEEMKTLPDGYSQNELKSKGFADGITIFDLPIRNYFFNIRVKRRRWTVIATGKTIMADLGLTEFGTKNTRDLSFFGSKI